MKPGPYACNSAEHTLARRNFLGSLALGTGAVVGGLGTFAQPAVSAALANPQNMGELPNADAIGTVGNADCRDMLRVWVKFKEEGGRRVIDRASFQSFGCETAIAAASPSCSAACTTYRYTARTYASAGSIRAVCSYGRPSTGGGRTWRSPTTTGSSPWA